MNDSDLLSRYVCENLTNWGRGGGYINQERIGNGGGDGSYWRQCQGGGEFFGAPGGADGSRRFGMCTREDCNGAGTPGTENYDVLWGTSAYLQLRGGDIFAECIYLQQRKKRLL